MLLPLCKMPSGARDRLAPLPWFLEGATPVKKFLILGVALSFALAGTVGCSSNAVTSSATSPSKKTEPTSTSANTPTSGTASNKPDTTGTVSGTKPVQTVNSSPDFR